MLEKKEIGYLEGSNMAAMSMYRLKSRDTNAENSCCSGWPKLVPMLIFFSFVNVAVTKLVGVSPGKFF